MHKSTEVGTRRPGDHQVDGAAQTQAFASVPCGCSLVLGIKGKSGGRRFCTVPFRTPGALAGRADSVPLFHPSLIFQLGNKALPQPKEGDSSPELTERSSGSPEILTYLGWD